MNEKTLTNLAKEFQASIATPTFSFDSRNNNQANRYAQINTIKTSLLDQPMLHHKRLPMDCLYTIPDSHQYTQISSLSKAKWDWPSGINKSKNVTYKLANNYDFSHEFTTNVSECNIKNVFGIDNQEIAVDIFHHLVEREMMRKFNSGDERIKVLLHIIDANHNRCDATISRDLVHWSIRGEKNSANWAEYVAKICTIPRLDAIATLAVMTDMEFSRLTVLSSSPHVSEFHDEQPIENIPDVIKLSGRRADVNLVEKRYTSYILGHSGQKIGAFVLYGYKDEEFVLPATVGKGELCMGKYKPTALFLNQDQLDKHPGAKILLFQDARVAIKILQYLEGDRTYDPREFIVTAHLGMDLSVLPWSYFYFHEVIFVPAPCLQSLAMVKAYAKYCADARMGQFCVANQFLLPYPMGDQGKDALSSLSRAESHILKHSQYLEDIDHPRHYLQNLIGSSTALTDFERQYIELGIFKGTKKDNEKTVSPHLSLPDADPSLKPANAFRIEDVTFNHILYPGAIVMLVGLKNSGKTQITYLLTKAALNLGATMWPFVKIKGELANICIVDGETKPDELDENLRQHGLLQEKDKRLHVLSRYDEHLPGFAHEFMLTSEEFRNGLFEHLLRHRCRVLILDNLTALMEGRLGNPSDASSVLNWAKELRQAGISVVMVMHKSYENTANNPDKSRGSQLFKELSRVVINLWNKDEIISSQTAPKEAKDSARLDGLTVGMGLITSKHAPVLENKRIWMHLDLGASEWTYLGCTDAAGNQFEIPGSESPINMEATSVGSDSFQGDGDITMKEKVVLQALLGLGGEANLTDIVQKIGEGEENGEKKGYGKDTVRSLLKELEEKGKVTSNRESNADIWRVSQ